MTRYLTLMLGVTGLLAASLFAAEVKLDNAKCPISAKPGKAEAAVDYKGGKVYLCCGGCPDEFKANTAKYATKANHQLAVTGQAKQEKCPLSGKALADGTEVDVIGTKVSFCCPNCQSKVATAKGDAQLDLVFSDKAFANGFKVAEAKK